MENKRCTRCLSLKPVSEFSFKRINKSGSVGYKAHCNKCLRKDRKEGAEKQTKLFYKWRVKNNKRYNEIQTKWRRARKKRRLEYIKKELGYLSCKRCGYDKCLESLHFHHNNPKQKLGPDDTFNKWIKHLSEAGFRKKIKNVDITILCSNCHNELHSNLWKI